MPCSTKLSSNKNVESNLKLTPDNLDYTTLYVLTEFRTESLALFGSLKEDLWFEYLVLKEFSVRPT